MRETIFMYTLGGILVIGMLATYAYQKGWVRFKESSFRGFERGELRDVFKASRRIVGNNRWLLITPIVLLLVNSVSQFLIMLFTVDYEIPFAKPETSQIPDFWQTFLSVRAVLDLVVGSPSYFQQAIYGAYTASILMILAAIISFVFGKVVVNYIKENTGEQGSYIISLTRKVYIFTLLALVPSALMAVRFFNSQSDDYVPLALSLFTLIIVPILTLLCSFVQAFIVMLIKKNFTKKMSGNRLVSQALQSTPNLFFMNLVLILISPSLSSSLLNAGQFFFGGDNKLAIFHYFTSCQHYFYLAICLLTAMLPFILTEKVGLVEGVKENFRIIHANIIKYFTVAAIAVCAISTPAIIKLTLARTYFSISIIAFIYDFIFASMQLTLSLLAIIAFGYLHKQLIGVAEKVLGAIDPGLAENVEKENGGSWGAEEN